MPIQVKFFASLRDQLGRNQVSIDATQIETVEDVWNSANPELALPKHILAAVNMDYADSNTTVKDGDEVAFFPPVTGG